MSGTSTSVQRADVYSRVTAEIITAIEQGTGEWRALRFHNGTSIARPTNVSSGKLYRGINTLALWAAGFAAEEYVELISAFCCASLGIVPTVRHADYIGSWLECLREDNRAIVRAASQASKAADWILSFLPGKEQVFPSDDLDDEREAA